LSPRDTHGDTDLWLNLGLFGYEDRGAQQTLDVLNTDPYEPTLPSGALAGEVAANNFEALVQA
jgi:hypothetical protein